MADVKIVDIDGSQWNMKDQVARDKITELEESLIPQALEDINIEMNVGFTATKAKLSFHYKIGKIHFAKVELSNLSGGNIGTGKTTNFGTINIHPKKETTFLLYDYDNNALLRCQLSDNGTLSAGESIGVVQGKNTCLGEIIFGEE